MRSAPTLSGTGFTLRPWREGDAAALEPACSDADIRRFSWVPASYSPDAAAAWIAHHRERLQEGTGLILAIEAAERKLPVGMVGIFALDERRARIGYWIIQAFRGRGLALEAARCLMTWAFAELAPEALQLDIEPHNVASQRVARQLGARPSGQVVKTEAGHRLVFDRYTIQPPPGPPG
jgi:[ribosomal protein S5]-alanine N-acetyltransferase